MLVARIREHGSEISRVEYAGRFSGELDNEVLAELGYLAKVIDLDAAEVALQ